MKDYDKMMTGASSHRGIYYYTYIWHNGGHDGSLGRAFHKFTYLGRDIGSNSVLIS